MGSREQRLPFRSHPPPCRTRAEGEGLEMTANDKSRAKADAITTAAWAIIDADKAKHDSKTARLRAAREAKEQADLLAHAPGKARAKAVKAKAKKRPTP